MNIFEYPHIQTAIKDVSNDLEYKKRICVIAAMGIGKSAIATKSIIDYANDNIIFAAPTITIINQIKKHLQNMGYDLTADFVNLKFYTYSYLHYMIKNGKFPECNLLICDEFHKISNKKRYQSIRQLFTYDDNKRYLGLSATPILQWEYENIYLNSEKKSKKRVNMAEVLYDNNVSFFYSIEDAFLDLLYPMPLYHEFFVLDNKNSNQVAIELLKQKKVKNITEDMVESLANYLEKEASLESILKRYVQQKNTKIMYFCSNFQDLMQKEALLKELFPQLSIYKTAYRLDKKENERNIEQFRNMEFNGENSKVLLSIKQVAEGFHTDGKMQLIFGYKTNAYIDFVQKYGRGCSLGNEMPCEILDLGGNLTRISKLDFLNLKDSLERKRKNRQNPSQPIQKMEYDGNMLDLNVMINRIVQNTFVSKKVKTNIYYDRIISNFGKLKDPKEKFKDGTYLEDWYKEMIYIASTELHLFKQNPEYQISEENMYIIETLAHIDNFFEIQKAETEEIKRNNYYKKAIICKDFLPKSETFRFYDGTYMSDWYKAKKRRTKRILNNIAISETYQITEDDFELILWMNTLQTDLKILWIEKILNFQRKEQESDVYKMWEFASEREDNNQIFLKTKRQCEAFENFLYIKDFYNGIEKRTQSLADKNFPYAGIKMDSIKKHLVLK